jgi:hypothetical protein
MGTAPVIHAGDGSSERENALRYLATTAGFDTVTTSMRLSSGSNPSPPNVSQRHDPTPPPEGTTVPGPELGDPGATQQGGRPDEVEHGPGPDGEMRVHEAMPAGAGGGPEHAPLDILAGEDLAVTAFVLTVLDMEHQMSLPPIARIGDVEFALEDDGEPPDVHAGDGRWGAVLERYPSDKPLEIVVGTTVLGSVPLLFEDDTPTPSLEVRYTLDGLSHRFHAKDSSAPAVASVAEASADVPGISGRAKAVGGALMLVMGLVGWRWRVPRRRRRRRSGDRGRRR